MRTTFLWPAALGAAALILACDPVDGPNGNKGEATPIVRLGDVAMLLSEIPIGEGQMGEVFDAVSGSSDNGYDEEYTMQDLFRDPGAGVGTNSTSSRRMKAPSVPMQARPSFRRAAALGLETKAALGSYEAPLRELLRGALENHVATKAGAKDMLGGASVDAYLDALSDSDIQIYWPYSEHWDWSSAPIITYDPEDGSEANIGYEIMMDENGNRSVREMIVTEDVAMSRPVWVVNRNDDSDYTSLELLRKNDPAWGNGGGNIIINPKVPMASCIKDATKAASISTDGSALLLKDFTMKRNYDAWFAGASEFFVKVGAVEEFVASTEAELRLYSPQITDFMIVVRRRDVGEPRDFNAVLVSNWTPQLERAAMMIIEDDGGTRTTWKCNATVKVQSKSYGFDMEIPLNTRDDIVWRGQLAYNYLTANNGKTGHFGDVDMTFEILDY
ncbi:MAG: hypothetical protein MJY72_05575 [Bacteroidales bacterium]|nr:hypothetical protein [Bacteroidales bacterium]